MQKLEIILIVTVIEVGKLQYFTVEELSEFWSALSICTDEPQFFATFSAKEQQAVKKALKNVERELERRGRKPVNFFQLMKENPLQVEIYLKQFNLIELLDMENDMKEYESSEMVHDFLKLVRKQIYNHIPVA